MIISYLMAMTMTSVIGKVMFQIMAFGEPRHPSHFFQKPWLLNAFMFAGMSFCWPLSHYLERKNGEPLDPPAELARPTNPHALVFVPAIADLIASAMGYMGLVYVSNSTALM